MKIKFISIVSAFCLLYNVTFAQPFTDEMKMDQCEKIRDACRHAWTGYLTYAKGYDALKPLSKTGHNWYNTSFLMTPVDAFDTFYLLGMDKEENEAQKIVTSGLTFDVDAEIQLFEVSIRLLGGLLSGYELSHDPKFLELATDLGKRLLPAFSSKTGMPWRYVNLKTGKVRDPLSNPAEIGTYILEFGKLTQYTGNKKFYNTAKKAMKEVYRRRAPETGLVGTVLNVETGKWTNTESQIGARIDSYYEYLYKGWLLFGDKELLKMWNASLASIRSHLYAKTPHGLFTTRVEMKTGKETRSYYGALDAYFAGLLALSGNLTEAAENQEANYHMWTRFGIEPEVFNFRTDTIVWPTYVLRPENLESCFYLYRFTKDEKYLLMGKKMVDDILEHCRTEAGFAHIKDVRTMKQDDAMESFFLAETLKYAWLLFAPVSALDLEKFVFNTEAHPLRKFKIQNSKFKGQNSKVKIRD